MIGFTSLRSEYVCEFWVPNCKECGDPLLTLGDGGEIVDRRGVGICLDCEYAADFLDPYGQPILDKETLLKADELLNKKERVQ